MPDRSAPRSLRARASLAPVVSLIVVVGLSASVGLARTVWGGPPAADATDQPAEPGPETDDAATPDGGDDLLAVDPAAQPIAEDLDAPIDDTSPSDLLAVDSNSVSVPSATALRSKMETGMAEIGELAVEARSDEDLVRATCVLDKQDRANDVMELGTSELLIIRDGGTSEQARSFALEKLDAAATRVDKLVEEAKSCSGRQGPEEEAGITSTESDEPRTVPLWDPSAGLGHQPTPPPLDGGWPPVASPTE